MPKGTASNKVGFEQDNVPLEFMHKLQWSIIASLFAKAWPSNIILLASMTSRGEVGYDDEKCMWCKRNEISDAAVAYQFSHPAMCSNATCPYLGDFELEVGYALVIISVLPSHDFRLVEFTAVPWR